MKENNQALKKGEKAMITKRIMYFMSILILLCITQGCKQKQEGSSAKQAMLTKRDKSKITPKGALSASRRVTGMPLNTKIDPKVDLETKIKGVRAQIAKKQKNTQKTVKAYGAMPKASKTKDESKIYAKTPPKKIKSIQKKQKVTIAKKEIKKKKGVLELDFQVENKTGKTIYITCFSYLHRRFFSRWRWNKSPVYKVEPNKSQVIDIISLNDALHKKNMFGYLGVFDNQEEADNAVYELLPDHKKLDLDQLIKLHEKKVTIEIERYGFKEPFYDYEFLKKKGLEKKVPELDFYTLNNTGKIVYVCCFVYEKKAKGNWIAATEDKDDMSVWRFDKTKVLKLNPNETGYIDVDTISTMRDQANTRGYLALFEEHEQKLALEATYELLESKRKLNLGLLMNMRNKIVSLEIEQYGIKEDIIDYIVKPAHKIDFKKVKVVS